MSLDYTNQQMRRVEQLMQPLLASGEVENTFSISGIGSGNRGFMVMGLSPQEERARSQQEIVGQINGLLRTIPGIRAFAIQPNSLGIRGAGRGQQFAVVGSNYDRLGETAEALVSALEQDGRFGRISMSYETTQPQLSVTIDRDRADDLGIDINGLAEAMQALLEGRDVGSVFIGDRSFDVKMLSTGPGAEAREALGWMIVLGLGMASMATLFLTPVAYLLLARFSKPQQEEQDRLHRELSVADEQVALTPAMV